MMLIISHECHAIDLKIFSNRILFSVHVLFSLLGPRICLYTRTALRDRPLINQYIAHSACSYDGRTQPTQLAGVGERYSNCETREIPL